MSEEKKINRGAAIDHIEKGCHKDKHLNQYGDQRKEADKLERDPDEKIPPSASTISGKKNAVQEHAHKDSEQRSE